MLSGFTNMLKKVLGDKAQRDVKEIEPIVKEIKKQYETLQSLSNDELRAETTQFKTQIQEYLKEDEAKIQDLKDRIENDASLQIDEKESLYEDIDKLEEKLYQISYQARKKIEDNIDRFISNKSISEETVDEIQNDLRSKTAFDTDNLADYMMRRKVFDRLFNIVIQQLSLFYIFS